MVGTSFETSSWVSVGKLCGDCSCSDPDACAVGTTTSTGLGAGFFFFSATGPPRGFALEPLFDFLAFFSSLLLVGSLVCGAAVLNGSSGGVCVWTAGLLNG